VLIVDETADEKSSADAAGAARQYSGTVGGIALCQVAVTVTYATGRGHALIGRALYLPEGCAADEEHRELAGVPEEVMFASKRVNDKSALCCRLIVLRGVREHATRATGRA
jgi:SRSO17 transposase